ncbi:hypothetical protein ACN20G_34090 (plasmid) [Streptomyces sp. BI20]|uniref:hypothetical protein n=1 Tax=Streptomyces sp. BI20 TaxID=3403460 RepID=UPI003C75583C
MAPLRASAVVALAVALGGCATVGPAPTSDRAPAPPGASASTPGSSPSAVPLPPSGRHGADPASWRLPLDAYRLEPADRARIHAAHTLVAARCMTEAGFPDTPDVTWTPPGWRTGEADTARRYGVREPAAAAEEGYRQAQVTAEAIDRDIAAENAGSPEERAARKRCASDASLTVPLPSNTPAMERINTHSFEVSRTDPAVRSAFTRWSACMKTKGLVYADPMAARQDPRFATLAGPTRAERDTARADAECRRRHGVDEARFDAENRYQAPKVAEARAELDHARGIFLATLEKARALLAEASKNPTRTPDAERL